MSMQTNKLVIEINELSNICLDLHDLLLHHNLPDEITNKLVELLNQVTAIYKAFTEEHEDIQKVIIDYQTANIELSSYVDQLLVENDKLQKFVAAAKKFPGFQC